MRKTAIAVVICAVSVGLTAAPGLAKKSVKNVGGTLTVAATPSFVDETATSVAASGNVKANSSCRKGRTVRFSYTDAAGATQLAETVVTKSNGNYSATLPKPATVAPATVTLTATVDQTIRKVKGATSNKKGKGKKKGHGKGKRKGRVFNCLEISGAATVTVAAPLPAP